MQITLIILIITCVVSFMAFSNQALTDKLIFYPPAIKDQKEWYRFITCGFIHADIMHLAFNMFSFYLFGKLVEDAFKDIFPQTGVLLYALMYITALVICLLPTYFKHRNNYSYRSLGASGAVSAVVFAGIFLYPTSKIGLFIIPPIIPAFVFAPIYLIITAYLDKKGKGTINHSAHLWGAIYGIVFLIVATYALSNFNLVSSFIQQVQSYFQSL